MKPYLFILAMSTLFACQSPEEKGHSSSSSADYSHAMKLDTNTYNEIFDAYKEKSLYHRRFKHADIDTLIQLHRSKSILKVEQIGESVQKRSIYELAYGEGKKKVMLWSQMHGDEPTATMALFDLFNFLEGTDDEFQSIRDLLKKELTLHFIPMLNPDGAEVYNRRNAQNIDLNRDARAGQTVEGALLRERAKTIQPQYGFNLHDQSIYYNVPNTSNPVTISMLAPAYNTARDINEVRGGAMQIIVGMNRLLQHYIPDAVAKYDDTHSPRGFGDNFQSWDASTVLIESGGLKGDPEKQQIRKLNFIMILHALIEIAEGSYKQYEVKDYEEIPFNASQLHDVVIRNLELSRDSITYKTDVAIRRGEITVGRDFYVRGRVEDIGDLKESIGYDELDAEGLQLIVGHVALTSLNTISSLNEASTLSMLKKGVIAAPLKIVGSTTENPLYNLPLVLFTQKQFHPTHSIDLGGTANFFIGDKLGNVKYAIVNGYLIDLEKGIQGQVFKNKVN